MKDQLRISRVNSTSETYEVEDDKNGALGITIELLKDWTCLRSFQDRDGHLHKSELFSDPDLGTVKKYALAYCKANYNDLIN